MVYGYIDEILELTYVDSGVPLFRCQWVSKNEVNCKYNGHTTVNLKKVAYKNDPFVFSQLVHQVFHIANTRNKSRHVVMPSNRNILDVDGIVDEDGYNRVEYTMHTVPGSTK